MFTGALARPDETARQAVSEWDEFVTDLGYDYDMYTVNTSDGWDLTLFRILPKADTTALEQPPVLLQHSSMMDAQTWIESQPQDYDPMPMQLVDSGLDVWMANSRGTKYSNVNSQYPLADEEFTSLDKIRQMAGKYDYSWAE